LPFIALFILSALLILFPKKVINGKDNFKTLYEDLETQRKETLYFWLWFIIRRALFGASIVLMNENPAG